MRLFNIITTFLAAFILNLITYPLFSKKLSKYGLYALNFLGGIILSAIVFNFIFHITEEQAHKLLPGLILILTIITGIITARPNGEEKLKTWYSEPTEDDDKEHFSKRDMHGQPWWKFMYIESWITLIVFNMVTPIGLLIFIYDGDVTFLGVGCILSIMFTPIVVWHACKRKRDYDNGYK